MVKFVCRSIDDFVRKKCTILKVFRKYRFSCTKNCCLVGRKTLGEFRYYISVGKVKAPMASKTGTTASVRVIEGTYRRTFSRYIILDQVGVYLMSELFVVILCLKDVWSKRQAKSRKIKSVRFRSQNLYVPELNIIKTAVGNGSSPSSPRGLSSFALGSVVFVFIRRFAILLA